MCADPWQLQSELELQEREEWLADENAQAEYQAYLTKKENDNAVQG